MPRGKCKRRKERIAAMKRFFAALAAAGLSAALLAGCAKLGGPELINVSYDPTREFYEAYNVLFIDHWEAETGRHLARAALVAA